MKNIYVCCFILSVFTLAGLLDLSAFAVSVVPGWHISLYPDSLVNAASAGFIIVMLISLFVLTKNRRLDKAIKFFLIYMLCVLPIMFLMRFPTVINGTGLFSAERMVWFYRFTADANASLSVVFAISLSGFGIYFLYRTFVDVRSIKEGR